VTIRFSVRTTAWRKCGTGSWFCNWADGAGLGGWESKTEEIGSTEKFLLMFPLKPSLCLGNGTIPQAV